MRATNMSSQKVVFIADKLKDDAVQVLEASGKLVVDNRPGLPEDEKLAAVRKANALIVRSATKVTREFLEHAEKLELIVRAGVGVDNIDVEAATRRGIVVQNVPEGNVRSAAEHTIALIGCLSRNIPQANASMKAGKWERSDFTGVEVLGKKLGVVGLGKIGRHVVQMATGLGFDVLCFDPFVSPSMADELKVKLVSDLHELASQVDFLTVHVPSSPETKGLIGKDVLDRAKPGLRVVNCARGGIIDEAALLVALNSGQVEAAAIDVFEDEPPGATPLVLHERVIATPHLGASTQEAQANVALTGAQQVVDYLLERKLHSPVNAITLAPDLRDELAPYHDLGLKLGRLQAQLLEGNPVRVVVKFYGDLQEPRVQTYLSSSVLAGFLGRKSASPVNVINARALAVEQGLAIEERFEGKSTYFAAMLKVEVTDGGGTREVGGAIRGRRGLRLVSLDAYQVDAVLEGRLLISANVDRPGMIGVLGTVLASNNINISNMALGRNRSGGEAIALMNVDAPCPEKVLGDIRSQDGILWAKVVDVEEA
jgi:D-3-phosphoglycerate dehydrogenase